MGDKMADTCTPCQFGGCAHCRPPCACDHGEADVVVDVLQDVEGIVRELRADMKRDALCRAIGRR